MPIKLAELAQRLRSNASMSDTPEKSLCQTNPRDSSKAASHTACVSFPLYTQRFPKLPFVLMNATYNRIAGQSVERLAPLSDGIFAVAMTLLVLDLRVPVTEAVHSERDLWHALVVLAPRFVMYMMSFLTRGIFWVGQQTQLNHLARSDRNLTWIHLAFLFSTALMPFSTTLLAEHTAYRIALLAYWGDILLGGVVLYASWGYAIKTGLVKDDIPAEVPAAIRRRIVIAQLLYAFGASLSLVNTYWSIGFIVLVQLNYAIAPRLWRRVGEGH